MMMTSLKDTTNEAIMIRMASFHDFTNEVIPRTCWTLKTNLSLLKITDDNARRQDYQKASQVYRVSLDLACIITIKNLNFVIGNDVLV